MPTRCRGPRFAVWVKLDDGFTEHPKIVGLTDAAFRLYVELLCYAARNLTDGYVPRSAIRSRGRSVHRLVDQGLLDRAIGGYQIHDWHEWNPPADVLKLRRKGSAERQARHRASRRDRNAPRNAAPYP